MHRGKKFLAAIFRVIIYCNVGLDRQHILLFQEIFLAEIGHSVVALLGIF